MNIMEYPIKYLYFKRQTTLNIVENVTTNRILPRKVKTMTSKSTFLPYKVTSQLSSVIDDQEFCRPLCTSFVF
jgi:uncharacterized protein (DUF1499 family)